MLKFMPFYVIIVLSLTACSGGGGGGGSPAKPPTVVTPLYPSSINSVYQIDQSYIQAGQKATITVTTKDQNSNNFALGKKWDIAIQVTCPTCQIDLNIAVGELSPIIGNTYQFTFTPIETNEYIVEVNFYPSAAYTTYSSDFPNGIDPNSLYALALSVPEFNVCNNAPNATIHGLRGTQIFSGITRMAICTPADLVLVATDSFFLDQDLYLANNIDLTSYYQNSGAEFSIGNTCSPADALANNCLFFTGNFYGNLNTISNFKRTSGLGLFGIVEGDPSDFTAGEISYLTLDSSTQSGGTSGGIVAFGLGSQGKMVGVSVTNSTVTGAVCASDPSDSICAVGGLVGNIEDAYVIASNSTATVTSPNIVGGLVGFASTADPINGFSRVMASYSSGSVNLSNVIAIAGGGFAGGLVGKSDLHLDVVNSYFSGQVTSQASAGGLVGRLYGTISSSYVSGTVSGTVEAGGLVGETDPGYANLVNNSFINSTLTSPGLVGAVAGACNSLNTNGFFINSLNVECGSQNSYVSSNISNHSYSALADLSAALEPVLTGWSWDQTVWNISQSVLPLIQ